MFMLKMLFQHLEELFIAIRCATDPNDIRLFQKMIDDTFEAIDFELKRKERSLVDG